jgi:phosphoribosylformylglycinamidine synthase
VQRAAALIHEHGYVTSTEQHLEAVTQFLEIGPRLAIETPFSTNACGIFNSVGLPAKRIEMSRRYIVDEYLDGAALRSAFDGIKAKHFDPLLQEIYPSPPMSLEDTTPPEPVHTVPVADFPKANQTLGLGMDDWDIGYYSDLFTRLKRDATDVELFQAGNGNSEHSRHWYFRGNQNIDGRAMPHSLMDLVKRPLDVLRKKGLGGSMTAFHDNAGVMRGSRVTHIVSERPGEMSGFTRVRLQTAITMTAETHNHPTTKAPFPGAETGGGGRIRDNDAVGRDKILQHITTLKI